MDKIRKILPPILLLVGAVCLIAAAFLVIRQRQASQNTDRLLEAMRQSAEAQAESAQDAAAPSPSGAQEDTQEDAPAQSGQTSPEEDAQEGAPEEPTDMSAPGPADTEQPEPVENPYRDSFLANEDMAAWIKIDNTVIDYPVMWTPRDENYYLQRNFKGQKDNNGCLILDTDSSLDPLTTNLIIHGHNMRSGAMFGTLTKYEDPAYCEEHSHITLYTGECERNYEVIAVFHSQVYRKTDQVFKFYKFFQADTEEEFDDFYQNIKALSLYDTGVTAKFGDRFLTLSTCAYHVEQGRFVVVAKETWRGDVYLPLRDHTGQ